LAGRRVYCRWSVEEEGAGPAVLVDDDCGPNWQHEAARFTGNGKLFLAVILEKGPGTRNKSQGIPASTTARPGGIEPLAFGFVGVPLVNGRRAYVQ
jgi:hypothetical protein